VTDADADMSPVIIKYTISIGLHNASRTGTLEVDRTEWNGMTPDERDAYVDELYQGELANVLDGTWYVTNATLNDPTMSDGK